MTAPLQQKTPMSESQFQMWRCVIAIAHADGQVQDEERKYLRQVFSNIDRVHGLSPDQRRIFEEDMVSPKHVADILPLVTEPQYRGMLVHFAEVLAWADNELSIDEENILKKLHASQMGSLDLDKLKADVRRQAEAGKKEREAELRALDDATVNRSPVLRGLNRLLNKLGVDLME